MRETYPTKVCERCGDEFETSCELEFDSESLCPKCRDVAQNTATTPQVTRHRYNMPPPESSN